MKLSNGILIITLIVTILLQVLLAFGYGEAYKLELLNQSRIQPFGAKFANQSFSAIVTDRVAFTLQNHPTQQGYKVRYSDEDDMKLVEFRAQNDTLYITNLKRTMNVSFDLYFVKIPNLICRNTSVVMKSVTADTLDIKIRSLSFLFMEGCTIRQLKAEARNKSGFMIKAGSTISNLHLTLKDEAKLFEEQSRISNVNYGEIGDKTHVSFNARPYKLRNKN
ncbi:hypothetical protein [Runella slithyformis]|uniref:Uncharacterized protein n=1 Tax=Runella slithyformis (strain ATCC 29530 / DSM 19594 / LMG 11500 / NCIMB 11436 / LSU 4) TaxID=761193 RepID=A0A7U3ZH26_RUNSL|nr:hypothetical protein [Runella slithyformis]AEI47060.1 hypothetical protein Runsl_0617 [Runella slithyformis DSM 19594]